MMMMINGLFQMEKESEEGMATDQETIRLLFYIVRLRDMVGILCIYTLYIIVYYTVYVYTSMMMIEVMMEMVSNRFF